MRWGRAAIAAWLALACPLPVAAQSESTNDLFKDLVAAGCLTSVETGLPIGVYAQGANLAPAGENLAAAFLRGKPGMAYIKATPQTVLIIAQSGETCTVASRITADPRGLMQAVDAMLTGLPSPFTLVESKSQIIEDGALSVTREYQGALGQRRYGVMVSTRENGPAPQAVMTLFQKTK